MAGERWKRYEGSYTVEAAFVMTIVLYAMVGLIQTAFGQCRQTVGNMRLQEMVEVLRHREDDEDSGLSGDAAAYELRAEREDAVVTGRVTGEGWSLDIESSVYDPEQFMRMLTLIQE